MKPKQKHDIMALTKAMAEVAGDAGWHSLRATSNDIVDTAVALQMILIVLLRNSLKNLIKTAKLADREKATVMLGRTHGQAAASITGLKVKVC